MKRLFIYLSLLTSLLWFIPLKTFAQSRDSISDDYDRSSLSIVMIEKNGSMNRVLSSIVTDTLFGDKFDINVIPTRSVRSDVKFTNDRMRNAYIDSLIFGTDIAKEIISFWFNRREDGTMDVDRILQRGMYNATDADYIRSEASRLGVQSLGDVGFSLISGSYVMVVDPVSCFSTTLKDVSLYAATVGVRLYKLKYSEIVQAQIFDCWIDPDDTPEERALKNEKFDKITFELIPKKYLSATAYGVDGDDAVEDAFYAMLRKMQNSEEKLQVKAPVYDVKPIRAKIGKKEGVRNTKRFNVYGYYQKEDGEIYSKRKGIVRAAKVCDNRYVADGESGLSTFMQIAGGKIEPGFILREKIDLGLGIGAGYRTGVYPGWLVQVEKLLKVYSYGGAHYVTAGFSASRYQNEYNPFSNISSYSAGIGYAYGYRFVRMFEVRVGASIEWDCLDDDYNDAAKGDSYGFMPYASLNINIAYPLQIFGGVCTSFYYRQSPTYKEMDVYLINSQRVGNIGFFGGLRIML